LGGSSNRLPGEDELGTGGPRGAAAPASSNEELGAPLPTARKRRHSRPPTVEKEWYSKAEAARYLGVAKITVTRYLQKGILEAQRLPTPGGKLSAGGYDYGRLRIHKRVLDRYLESVDRVSDDTRGQARSDTAPRADASSDTDARPSANVPSDYYLSEVLTREEAALRLGVSWRTIKRYVETGKLRLAGYLRCPDSYTRAHVFRADVEKLLMDSQPPGRKADVKAESARGHV
jgi:hypothetical protein